MAVRLLRVVAADNELILEGNMSNGLTGAGLENQMSDGGHGSGKWDAGDA